ncbi:MAG: hypothetical protein AAGH53_10105 [Pseudomonadota bacterium]
MPAWIVDNRLLDSSAIWTKPQKFNISLALHFITLAVLAQMLPAETRNGWVMRITAYLAAGAFIAETIYIIIQASRGRRSHYNFDTPLETAIYIAMGVGAVMIVSSAAVLAVQLWRKAERKSRGLWLGSVVGLATGFAATLYFTSYLSDNGRYIGAPLEGGGVVVPFFGWSREYGDLRPAHFVALHMMQTVPFAGWLADRLGWNSILVVGGATILQLVAAIALFVQALAGKPIWPV